MYEVWSKSNESIQISRALCISVALPTMYVSIYRQLSIVVRIWRASSELGDFCVLKRRIKLMSEILCQKVSIQWNIQNVK